MAYNKTFNPDALPANPEPEQAAQQLSHLSIQNHNQRPAARPSPGATSPAHYAPRQDSFNDRRQPAPTHQSQQSYRPHNIQTSNNFGQGYNSRPDPRLQSPPPPADYGSGPRPRPPQGGYTGPPPQQYTQHTQQYVHNSQRTIPPPDADSAELHSVFRAANVSGTGSLTTSELGSALVNADSNPFDPLTIRSLMRMFSTSPPSNPSGPVIVFSEFQNLWKFLAAWRQLFERFDEDGSGKISLPEFTNALVAFGYRLSQPFINLLYTTFNERNDERRGSRAGQGGMSFDLFVQACIRLKRMTDVFKTYDEDRDGYVTLSFEEFLSEILKLQQE